MQKIINSNAIHTLIDLAIAEDIYTGGRICKIKNQIG